MPTDRRNTAFLILSDDPSQTKAQIAAQGLKNPNPNDHCPPPQTSLPLSCPTHRAQLQKCPKLLIISHRLPSPLFIFSTAETQHPSKHTPGAPPKPLLTPAQPTLPTQVRTSLFSQKNTNDARCKVHLNPHLKPHFVPEPHEIMGTTF